MHGEGLWFLIASGLCPELAEDAALIQNLFAQSERLEGGVFSGVMIDVACMTRDRSVRVCPESRFLEVRRTDDYRHV